jgi:hypothetical protein
LIGNRYRPIRASRDVRCLHVIATPLQQGDASPERIV